MIHSIPDCKTDNFAFSTNHTVCKSSDRSTGKKKRMAYRRSAIGLQHLPEAIIFTNNSSWWSMVSLLDHKPSNPLWVPRVFMSLLSMKKDPALETALKINRRWTINNQLKSIIQRCPEQTASVDFLQKKFNNLDIRKGKALNWLRKYPCLFETYTENFLTYVRFSKRMRLLIEEEEAVKEQQEDVLAEKLEKILMLTRKRRLNVIKFGDLRKNFGFPDDYVLRIAGKEGVFRVLDCEEKRQSLEIQLVEWSPRIAVSFVERKARERAKSVPETENRLSEGFGKGLTVESIGEIQEISYTESENPMQEFEKRPSKGFGSSSPVEKLDNSEEISHEEGENPVAEYENRLPEGFGNYALEKFNKFQKIPYISPYECIEGLQEGSEELEKWRVGVIHELLSLTLWKRASVVKLAKLKREFGFPENLVSFLMKHPAIFYVSNQNDIHTVVLRECYADGELIDKDPLVVMKEKFGELMQEGLYEYTERRRKVNLEKIRKPSQPLWKMSNDFKQLGREIFKHSRDTTAKKEERYQKEARERFRRAF